ncbi:hypothetical protein CCM_04248 [Cordyceps militaris CM01]|uniref:Uncharacterized protein n=1 Tax=Cordyceps militaris (strain CM01) TaxID=983644 RepID=G3JE51_CORMM|nr:uncharacterized protein CCM_04248 [Cordyceps militaris CM01]EGX92876.1 hypothetical protein CCM_04248 [Cordyceps militaris CM01]
MPCAQPHSVHWASSRQLGAHILRASNAINIPRHKPGTPVVLGIIIGTQVKSTTKKGWAATRFSSAPVERIAKVSIYCLSYRLHCELGDCRIMSLTDRPFASEAATLLCLDGVEVVLPKEYKRTSNIATSKAFSILFSICIGLYMHHTVLYMAEASMVIFHPQCLRYVRFPSFQQRSETPLQKSCGLPALMHCISQNTSPDFVNLAVVGPLPCALYQSAAERSYEACRLVMKQLTCWLLRSAAKRHREMP